MEDKTKLYPSMRYICSTKFRLGMPHLAVVSVKPSVSDTRRSPVKLKLMTGSYSLQTNRPTSNQHHSTDCLLCKQAPETRAHFLIHCSALATCRDPCMNRLSSTVKDVLGISLPDCTPDDVLLIILDVQKFVIQTRTVHMRDLDEIETVARHLCYRLHNERWNLLNRLPRRDRAKKKKS